MSRQPSDMSHERRKRCVTPLSLILLLLGSLWVSLLATICITTGELKPRGTYVSENALMPGSALTDVNGIDMEQRSFPSSSDFGDLGFFGLKGVILRSATASDRREAICVVAQEGRGDDVLYALSHALHRAKWLSKDVLFVLLPKNEIFSTDTSATPLLRRWLETYEMSAHDDKIARGGPIRGAVIIDIPHIGGRKGETPFSRESILVQGMNGRLPNMDLINVARITVPSYANGRQSFFASEQDDTDSKSLQGLRFARDVLLGPTGWHGEFLRLGVDALTLKASNSSIGMVKPGTGGTTRLEFAQRIEKMVRSLSNIGEKLNRSFFFYLMLGTDSFVSIDEFLWALIVFVSPLVVDALFVAAAPNDNGFKETRRALASLGLAVLSGLALLIVIEDVPLPAPVAWLLTLILYALWERFAALRRLGKEEQEPSSAVEDETETATVERLPFWRYKKTANEVYVFISLAALGVVHFPLAMFAAILCFPSTRLALAMPWNGSTMDKTAFGFVQLGFFGVLYVLLGYQAQIPLGVGFNRVDLKTAVLYLVVLPSYMLTLSIFWSPPETSGLKKTKGSLKQD